MIYLVPPFPASVLALPYVFPTSCHVVSPSVQCQRLLPLKILTTKMTLIIASRMFFFQETPLSGTAVFAKNQKNFQKVVNF